MKYMEPTIDLSKVLSHPTGVRGLKCHIVGTYRRVVVAPHWGAWIEIAMPPRERVARNVAPHWGAWIEMYRMVGVPLASLSRTPLGCVD